MSCEQISYAHVDEQNPQPNMPVRRIVLNASKILDFSVVKCSITIPKTNRKYARQTKHEVCICSFGSSKHFTWICTFATFQPNASFHGALVLMYMYVCLCVDFLRISFESLYSLFSLNSNLLWHYHIFWQFLWRFIVYKFFC